MQLHFSTERNRVELEINIGSIRRIKEISISPPQCLEELSKVRHHSKPSIRHISLVGMSSHKGLCSLEANYDNRSDMAW